MNIFIAILLFFFAWFIYSMYMENRKKREHQKYVDRLTPEGRAVYDKKSEEERLKKEEDLFIEINGPINAELICTHCQTKGTVHSKNYSLNRVVKGKIGGILKTDIKMNQIESGTLRYCKKCESRWTI